MQLILFYKSTFNNIVAEIQAKIKFSFINYNTCSCLTLIVSDSVPLSVAKQQGSTNASALLRRTNDGRTVSCEIDSTIVSRDQILIVNRSGESAACLFCTVLLTYVKWLFLFMVDCFNSAVLYWYFFATWASDSAFFLYLCDSVEKW